MSNYTQITDFSVKDSLASGDAAKVIKGSDIDAELSAISTAIATKTETGDIPSGSAMLFTQASAPTGWTKSVTHNNKALRITSSSGGGTGGTVAFTTALDSHTVSISGTSGATTLVEAQTPVHNHDIRGPTVASGSAQYSAGNSSGTGSGNYGGGGSHTHSFSDTYTLNLDVQFVDVIICTKD